jgi:photosystem II stability/assembly factor-like uncharacterized protein
MSLRGLFVCALLVISPALYAAEPSALTDLRWRSIGPFRAGRVLAVSGVSGEPEHFYFGSVNGGVWETKDAGRTWQPIFDSQPVGSIGALAVAPSQPQTIYVGSGEGDMRSDIAQGNGMYKTDDGGKSWMRIGLDDSQQIARILVHPSNPSLAYVAALGHPYGPNAERGVYRTRDGGKSWQKILGRDNDTGAVDLAFEPGNASVLYAALWQTRRTPWSIYPPSNGPGSGLYKSIDGGDTWKELRGHGLPEKPGRIGLAVAPSRPQRVYAIIDAAAGGMFRSDDGGATWTRAGDDARMWGRGWYFGGITVEPKDPDTVYSCNTNLLRSTDAGKTWAPVKGAPGGDDYHTLWIDQQHPERRILGVDQGTVVSLNGGQTWSSWYNQPTGQFYHVVTDNQFPYWVYGSQQDSGAAGVPSRTNTIDGINLTQFREVTSGGESDNVAPDPDDPQILYGGRVEKLDLRTNQTRSVDPTIAHPENYRRTWTLPLVFSPRDRHALYFANQLMFRTDDGGNHWSVISPDLTREDPGTPSNLDPTTAALNTGTGPRRGVIYTIAPSRTADDDIWAGTDDGSIWRGRLQSSNGTSPQNAAAKLITFKVAGSDRTYVWQNITPAGLTGWSKVGIIDASHFDSETAYAAVDRHRLDDFRPYIYRTHDGGRSWQLVANGIARDAAVNVVREDSVKKGLLYAGTERGMYVSLDDGDHWQTFQANLPVTSVRDIDVHGNDLVLATHGRAFWIMDDVTPLRQLEAAQGNFLFTPATAIRERAAGFTGTPMPKDEAMAPNPPLGATIDYAIGGTRNDSAAVAHKVSLDIVDGKGALVRHYSSDDVATAPNPATLRVAPEWFQGHTPLASTPGIHRFVWPIRYHSAGKPNDAWSDGIWAPPGNYTIALTVDGLRMTQPLVVVPDPRIGLSQSAYDEQFALARQVEQLQLTVKTALGEAEDFMSTVDERHASATPDIKAALDKAASRAAAISDIVPGQSGAWWLSAKTKTSLRFVDAALEALMGVVDGADGAPSTDAVAGYRQLSPVAGNALAAWSEFKRSDVPALNATLKSAGQKELPIPK